MPKKAKTATTQQPKQKRPRPTAFSKANPSPNAFQPGESGNPGGKPKEFRALSRTLRISGAGRAPDSECATVGLPKGSSKLQVAAERISLSMRRGQYPEHLQATELYAKLTGEFVNRVEAVFDEDGQPQAGPMLVVNFITSRLDEEYQQAHPHGPWPVTSHEVDADGTHYVSSHTDPKQRRVLVAPGRQAPAEITESDVDMVRPAPEILPPGDVE